MERRIRDFTAPLSLYYTHGSAGSACAGAQAKGNMMFSINKALHSDFPKPAEDLQRIFMPYIHAVIAENEIPTAKPYRPNWKNIFSQLGNYFFAVKYNLIANKYTEAFQPLFSGYYCCLFLIVLRDNETSCQTKSTRQRLASTIKANSGHLLRPTPAIY